MAFNRGDILNVYFELPNYNKADWHPGLIISNEDVYLDDDCYIVVMLTSSEEFEDKYTYNIEDFMLNKPLPKKSQVRCHIVSTVLSKHFTSCQVLASLKEEYVDAVVQRIVESSLEV